jgi:hypothetical protein
MLPQHVILALVAAVAAVPLNINLGAYSPALVVGDGEISLGSTESASELMATLASGANEGAAAGGEGAQGQQEETVEAPQEEEQTEGEPQTEEQPAEEDAAKRALAPFNVRTVDHLGKRSPAADNHIAAVEGAMEWIKRDLEGFNAALTYAREAMQNSPKIEMGSEGAGVGIVVNAGLNVPADSAANGAEARRQKRSEVVAEESEAPKMTLVAITEV